MIYSSECWAVKKSHKQKRKFGHVCRKGEEDAVKKVWGWNRGAKLGRGRPEQTWEALVKRDMKHRGLLEKSAQDRARWREAICIPTPVKQGDRR